MTKAQLEGRLKILLSVEAAVMFYRDGQFTIYSPVGRTPCSGSGETIQQAIFAYDFKRSKIVVI